MKAKTVSTNGASSEATASHAGPTAAASEATNGALPLERAEKLVDEVGEKIGRYASNVGLTLSRWVARAKEEIEDIVAEADSLRRHEPPQ